MKANRILAAAVMALGLLSCKGEAPKEAPQRKMDFPVSISIEGNKGAMRAAQQGTSLTASYQNEHAIENLTIVVFSNNSTAGDTPSALEKVITEENIVMPAGSNPYDGVIKFDMEAAGTYHMEVIANGYKPSDAAAKAALLAKLSPGLSYTDFKNMVFDRALPKHGESGFAMLGTDPVKVTTERGKTANAGKIVLRRLACRFDVFNKLLGDELVLTKATLQNQIKKSYLLTQTAVPADADGGIQSYEANNDWFTASVIAGGIYSYENPAKGATTLLLEGTYKGTPWKKTIEFKDGGNAIAMQRNHLYRVYLTKGTGVTPGGDDDTADKVNYEIEVLDWEQGDDFYFSDDDVVGRFNQKRVSYSFDIDKTTLREGSGHVTGTKIIWSDKTSSARILSKEPLAPGEFTLTLKGVARDFLTIDNNSKDFTVAAGDLTVPFTLEAKHAESGTVQTFECKRIGSNPLLYMAEYYLNRACDGFQLSDEAYDNTCFELYDEAIVKFKSFEIDGIKYHLPTYEEWKSVFSDYEDFFEEYPDKEKSGLFTETVSLGGASINCTQEFLLGKTSGTFYAIRYKGSPYESVWRYYRVEANASKSLPYGGGDAKASTIVECKLAKGKTLEEIAKESFWQQPNLLPVVRKIPIYCTGYIGSDGKMYPTESIYHLTGSLMCADKKPDRRMLQLSYSFGYMKHQDSLDEYYRDYYIPVRLFRDTLE